ncbi:MAG: 2-keto-4-pentenoate hydratase, partial [Sciscionella sp.]
MLTAAKRVELAERLARAERDRTPIDPPALGLSDMDVIDAYQVQLLNIRRRVSDGARVAGHKIGLSSAAMQQMMGVDEPDYGHLLDDMRLAEDKPVDSARYCFPRVEIEVGFVLGSDLPGEGCAEADVIAATEALAPAIELIDSRIADWKIGICDTIADNASSAGFVLGVNRIPPSEVDVTAIDAVLWSGDEAIASGRSDAVLGNPATAVAWLAAKVAHFGVRLKAGDIVLPGSCIMAMDVHPAEEFTADFSGLGTVRLT